nr:MAG TPA: hypothetical protein [Caudoviricetes sp.]
MNIKFKSFHFILLFKVLCDYFPRCLMSLSTTIFILCTSFLCNKKAPSF